jgi:hypothetical protein
MSLTWQQLKAAAELVKRHAVGDHHVALMPLPPQSKSGTVLRIGDRRWVIAEDGRSS